MLGCDLKQLYYADDALITAVMGMHFIRCASLIMRNVIQLLKMKISMYPLPSRSLEFGRSSCVDYADVPSIMLRIPFYTELTRNKIYIIHPSS